MMSAVFCLLFALDAIVAAHRVSFQMLLSALLLSTVIAGVADVAVVIVVLVVGYCNATVVALLMLLSLLPLLRLLLLCNRDEDFPEAAIRG